MAKKSKKRMARRFRPRLSSYLTPLEKLERLVGLLAVLVYVNGGQMEIQKFDLYRSLKINIRYEYLEETDQMILTAEKEEKAES